MTSKIPTSAMWYFACAAAGVYFYLAYSNWLNVGVIFLIYVAGFLFSQIEYKRGVVDTTKTHNDAMEKALAESREWWELNSQYGKAAAEN